MDHISMKNIHLEMDGNSEMSAMIHSIYLGNYVLENMYIYICIYVGMYIDKMYHVKMGHSLWQSKMARWKITCK